MHPTSAHIKVEIVSVIGNVLALLKSNIGFENKTRIKPIMVAL